MFLVLRFIHVIIVSVRSVAVLASKALRLSVAEARAAYALIAATASATVDSARTATSRRELTDALRHRVTSRSTVGIGIRPASKKLMNVRAYSR
ncbi:MAG: hypothetical protein ACREJC_22985, partial [Tepidisphaeraceae bacterium]